MGRSRSAAGRRVIAGLAVVGTVLAGAIGPVSPANAFPPTRLMALGSHSHQSITEQVITRLDQEFFSVATPTRSMRSAIEEIVEANTFVDQDQFHSEKHFDGENFAGGQRRVIGLFELTLEQLEQGRGKIARFDLGQALHTIQDFYAHSNWLEMPNTAPNQDLGRPGRTLGPVAGPDEPTCDGFFIITSKLTSGYYGGEDRRPTIDGKCRHGGPFDDSPGESGINKDTRIETLSPHTAFHEDAARLAAAATEQFIRDIRAKITDAQLRLLLGAGPTLGLSFDTTGSMAPIIDGVKAEAIRIVDARLDTDQEPSRYVLAPFSDPAVGPVLVTDDPDVFKAQINSLPADGGGDCPELSMSGMLQALSEMDRGGNLFVFTDASSKDAGLAGTVSAVAGANEITIYPMVFGSCSPIDPAYFRVAAETGGQVFDLSITDAGTITRLADFLVRANTVDILKVAAAPESTPQTFDIPVDSSMTHLTVSVSGTDDVQVTRPDGSVVEPDDPETEIVSLSSESAPARIVAVGSPEAGVWTVTMNGEGEVSLVVSGESELDLSRFGFVQEEELHGLAGLVPIPGLPALGRTTTAHAVLTDGFETAQFELRTIDGAPLQPLGLTPEVDNDFTGELTPPEAPFRLYVTGADTSGAPFQRLLPAVVQAQPLIVTPPPPSELRPGETTSYTFQVENLGPEDTFAVSVVDDQDFVRSATPETLTLGTDESASVTVELEPPDDAAAYTSDRVVVDVSSTTRPEVHNFAVLVDTVAAAEEGDEPAPGGSGGDLPVTGLDVRLIALVGLLVLTVGGLLLLLAGRRIRAART